MLRFRVRGAVVGLLGLSLLGALHAEPASADQATKTYVVTTAGKDGNHRALARLQRFGRDVRPSHTYKRALRGFAAKLTAAQVARLEADPDVVRVTQSVIVRTTATQDVDGSGMWGLDRIDRHANKLNGTYNYPTTGSGVTVFEIDSGVQLNHTQFGGRVVSGYDFVDRDTNASDCRPDDGGIGHGTHVAGIIGGSTYGVAKRVKIVAVRAFDCDGEAYLEDILAALDWVAGHRPSGPAVINFSGATGEPDASLDDAVQNMVAAGISVVVSAGNGGEDATNASPANAPDAITVGWANQSGSKNVSSNYGSRIDVFAPGNKIRSALSGNTSRTRNGLLSGTSMAAPMVTGAVARYLQAYPKATPAQVRAALVGESTKNAMTSIGEDSPNRMLYLRRSVAAAPIAVATERSVDQRTLKLSWRPPYGFGTSAVSGYHVTRTGTDANGRTFATTRVAGTGRDFTWTDLRPGVKYTVTVAALNSFGRSAAASRTS